MVVIPDHQVKSAQAPGLRSGPVSDIVAACARRASRIANVLPTYRFCVAWREKHGIVRPPARDEMIDASGLREAIAVALSHGDSLVSEGTNLAYLTDEEGLLVWSLRMDEFNAESR